MSMSHPLFKDVRDIRVILALILEERHGVVKRSTTPHAPRPCARENNATNFDNSLFAAAQNSKAQAAIQGISDNHQVSSCSMKTTLIRSRFAVNKNRNF